MLHVVSGSHKYIQMTVKNINIHVDELQMKLIYFNAGLEKELFENITNSMCECYNPHEYVWNIIFSNMCEKLYFHLWTVYIFYFDHHGKAKLLLTSIYNFHIFFNTQTVSIRFCNLYIIINFSFTMVQLIMLFHQQNDKEWESKNVLRWWFNNDK